MIFNNFFRAKHLSPDPQVRIQAIGKLNHQAAEQKSILHELAFNDADPKVSLAALQRLDSFVLWYKMSEIAKDDLVQRKSLQLVEKALLSEDDTYLTTPERRNFILEVKQNSLVEKLLSQPWVQIDTELSIALLNKIDRPSLRDKLFLGTKNEALQLAILATFEDDASTRKLLNKFLKKSSSTLVKDKIEELLAAWLRLEKLPLEVEQRITMLLSQLLTLKDSQDLPYIERQQDELNQQYKQLSVNFKYLNATKLTEIEQKYIDIANKVKRNIEQLKPVWQAQQEKLELQVDVEKITTNIEACLEKIKVQLDTRLSEISTAEVDSFKFELVPLSDELLQFISRVSASEKTIRKHLEQLNNKINSQLNTLSNLVGFQSNMHSMQILIEQFESLSLPNDASQVDAAQEYLSEKNKEWRDLVGENRSLLPKELNERWNKQTKSWKKAIVALRSEMTAELNRCRSKLKAVDSLVRQGKFKAAMGLYQKVQTWFVKLSDKQQEQLQRAYSNVQEQIETLKDWQDYISAPRKPALLKEVERLVAEPLDVEVQSKTIKGLRSQWNSLGKTDTESDLALNEAFELAIEAAFAPCREHYDQQQKLRETNLQMKQKVLEDIQGLSVVDISCTDLAKQLRTVQQTWKNIGEVDHKLRSELHETFQSLVMPLKEKVNGFYNDNAQQKQKLVEQAQSLAEYESIDDAIEQAKKLQDKWKLIEHAGRKAEAQLWPAFRQANDSLFTKRAELNQQLKIVAKQNVEDVKLKVAEFNSSLSMAKNKNEIRLALEGVSEVQNMLRQLPSGLRKTLDIQINGLYEKQKQRLSEISNNEKEQEYVQLFKVLRDWEQGSTAPDVGTLRKKWQSGFSNIVTAIDRNEITLKMEVLADKPSPESEQAKRKQVQMELMAQKLQSGQSLDLSHLLIDWIKGGGLSTADKPLLARVERVFVA